MSAAAELIRTARKAGADIRLHGERVRVTPRDPLPADLLESLRAHKADVLAELKASDAVLLSRCREACRGLPILPLALYESLTAEDRAAQYSGEEGPSILRAYAESIADRLKAGDENAAEYLAEREAICAESGERLHYSRTLFRYRLAWNPELWHYLILVPDAGLADARERLKREHGKALLCVEAHKLATAGAAA